MGQFSGTKSSDPKQEEVYFRLNSIFMKNKYGYNTRFMSDFDLLLEGVLNERFIDESTLYTMTQLSLRKSRIWSWV